jgi:hypothetical protein
LCYRIVTSFPFSSICTDHTRVMVLGKESLHKGI